MNPRFRLTRQAEEDVLEIWMHIAADSVEAADQLADRLTKSFELLASQPKLGTTMKDYRPGLRGFSVGSYVIFFTPASDGVEIYRVLHGARNFDDLL